jgi:hypothetical protein
MDVHGPLKRGHGLDDHNHTILRLLHKRSRELRRTLQTENAVRQGLFGIFTNSSCLDNRFLANAYFSDLSDETKEGGDEDAWPEARQHKTINASGPAGARDEVVFESSTRNRLHKGR